MLICVTVLQRELPPLEYLQNILTSLKPFYLLSTLLYLTKMVKKDFVDPMLKAAGSVFFRPNTCALPFGKEE